MLESLRTAAGTWVAKLLLCLLVLSFAIWGISGQLTQGFGGNAVLTAGDTKVSAIEYRLAYERALGQLSQQYGTRLTREQATSLGIDSQVMSQLTAGALLDEQASELGLGLSEDRLAQLTVEDPAFHGPDGRFNRQQFDYALRQVGMRPEDYLANRAKVAVRQQVVEAVSDGLRAPDTFLRAVALYRGEDRTAEYVIVPKSAVGEIEEPAADVLAKWFEDNKKTYAAPEYRKFSYVRLLPQDIADEAAISDEQVKAEYEKNKARFTTPETRAIQQIVFKSEEAAQAAFDSLKTGATFDTVMASESKNEADVALGTLSRDKVPDAAVAEAAFKLQAGEVSPVVKGAFGALLLRVTAINPEVVRPLAEATPEIRKDLALAEASRVLLDVHDRYEDARAGGESLVEAAQKLSLKVVTVDAIDRSGQRPDATVVNDLPDPQTLLPAVFEAEPGVENPGLQTASNGYVFYEVEGATPARDRTLDEVRDRVVADWKSAQALERLQAKAAEFEKRVKDGAPLDTIATELAAEKQTKRGLKREADDVDFGQSGVQAVFAVAEGGTGLIASPQGDGQIVFKVTEVFEPAGADASSVAEDQQKAFSSGLADDLLDQLVARLQGEYPVTVDQGAVERAHAF